MLGLIWFGTGAYLGFKGTKYSHINSSHKIVMSDDLGYELPSQGVRRTRTQQFRDGSTQSVSQSITPLGNGKAQATQSVVTKKKAGIRLRLVGAGVGGFFFLVLHSCANIAAPYRDWDNSLDHIGLSQIGLSLNQ